MSMVVKCVCFKCNMLFVKNVGCNKLICFCGYKMCYVCCVDFIEEGYCYYCDYFCFDGDFCFCIECDCCNLWELEDMEEVLC